MRALVERWQAIDVEAEREAWLRQGPIVTAALSSVLIGPDRVRRRTRDRAAEAIEAMPTGLRDQRAMLVARNLGQPVGEAETKRFGSIADEHVRREFSRRATQGIEAVRTPRLPVAVEGREHLANALAEGRGVVLWRMNLAGPAPLNKALADLGWAAVHLSSVDHHVVAGSVLSRHLWSKISMRSEVRSLRERVVFSAADGGHGYMKTLKQRLAEGCVVTIVGDSRGGSRQIPVTVCGNRWFVPTGGPSLAQSAGAPLLTAHVVDDRSGATTVVIGPPIEADRSNRRTFRTDAAHELAARLESALLGAPEARLTLSTMRRRPVNERPANPRATTTRPATTRATGWTS